MHALWETHKLSSFFLQVYLLLSGVFCIGTVTVKQYVPGRIVQFVKMTVYLNLKQSTF